MYVKLGYVRFAIPMRVTGHELNTIDLTRQDGYDLKVVGEVRLLDNGWVEILPANGSVSVYASPDCCRQAIGLSEPPTPTTPAPGPLKRANSATKKIA